MNETYTVPSGATAMAGSQVFRLDPTVPGTLTGASQVRPPSVDLAKEIPLHPIQSS
jgi:hypothetical protein